PASGPDHPPHPVLRETQRAEPDAFGCDSDGGRSGGTGRNRTAPPQRAAVALRGRTVAQADGRPDPDRTGPGQPAEERSRVDRARQTSVLAPQRGAARHPQAGRRTAGGRVLRARFRPGPRARSDGTSVRSFLLHQGRGHGHRAELVPHDRRVAPGPDACREHLQWSRCRWLPFLLLDSCFRRYKFDSEQERWGDCMSLIPKKGTVYVVDDDEAVRDSLQWLLEGKDYRVRCFDSAESFLSRYDPREVACLIVDIRMGGMTGLELQDRLLERKSPLPIVFITGHGDVPMAVNTMKKGAMDFIQKPFKEDELVSLVERMLDHAK